MVNKLKALSASFGAFLLALSAWAALEYGSPVRFLLGFATGVTILVLPRTLASAKRWLRRGWRYVKTRTRDSDEVGTTFVSERPDPNPDEALTSIADAVSDHGDRDTTIRRETFPEGDGLMVTHGGFHNSFIRLTDGGRLVVTGASKRTRSLARYVGDVRGVPMRSRLNNPLHGPIPVRGAPRWFLALFLVALLVGGVGSVANAAYATDTYNTAEKAVLVSYDARADFDPWTTPTEARLGEAEFVVGALSEEAVEIQWEKNASPFLAEDGRQALAMSEDVREKLRTARGGSLTPAQAERADRIETDLHAAERDVAAALKTRIEDGTAGEYADELRTLRRTLLRASNTPV